VSAPREVVVDARWLRTGIGRYIRTLLTELKRRLPDTQLICITMPEHVAELKPLCDRVIEMRSRIYSLTEQLRLPMLGRNAAVFCAPHYNIPILHRGPIVVTIHDLTHLLFPGYRSTLRSRVYAKTMLRVASARASRIVTPSQYTRNSLIARLGADPTKITVVPCAVGDAFHPQPKEEARKAVQARQGIDAPYMLFVGSTAPHKNLLTLLKAYRLWSSEYRGQHHLVLVLPADAIARCGDSELATLLATPGVRCLHSLPDESLASLYSAAAMTVMPSFEEGFGLPVIESMACGTPALCSRAASLPEIAGANAIYFDPHSAEEMAWAIEKLLSSEDLRGHLVTQGLSRAATFSTVRAATAYAAILSSIIEDEMPTAAVGRAHEA
jgi:glycosyltransferase involved in cell wall biosynthesis